ncbi:divalent metal cation transporter [Sphingomonas sp. ASV193]|uniref:NRAMP family divalent metal transporter n=1 Tax=Sphingomonas sp. ASV193 TaxID=3144405 RepID=UPI0032E8D44B
MAETVPFETPQSEQQRETSDPFFASLGPGIVTGAADDDPSGIATYSQAGAQFGYGLLWTMVLTYPLMSAVQLVSAHIGRVTGRGLARNLTRVFPNWAVTLLVVILLVTNMINIGADLAAMAAAVRLVAPINQHLLLVGFAALCAVIPVMVPYSRYSSVLKWLTLSLFAYIGVILLTHVDWGAALHGLFIPTNLGRDAIETVVAVFGTTISPYLFFWQSAQEAQEIGESPDAKPIRDEPSQAPRQFRRIRFDTLLGMAFSNIVALAVMVATAATLHAAGTTQLNSAADAASALRPIAGDFAFALFAIGIVGTGLLAVPVLAGSAAFALSETRGWRAGLELKPGEAKRFYLILAAATLVGAAMVWTKTNPVQLLVWSAVINGVAAVPIMAAMMIVASSRKVMGDFTESRRVLVFGWIATAVMAAAAIAMIVELIV